MMLLKELYITFQNIKCQFSENIKRLFVIIFKMEQKEKFYEAPLLQCLSLV